jgi:starvation-inducible DNA-binding protein
MARRTELPKYTVPSLTLEDGAKVAAVLQTRLNSLNDLALTLKHIHWNVVGPHFIAVHTMLDPQVDAVRLMVDEIAERIATLGVAPLGTPGALVAERTWDDYSIGPPSSTSGRSTRYIGTSSRLTGRQRTTSRSSTPSPTTC